MASRRFPVGMGLLLLMSLADAQSLFETRLDSVPVDFRTQPQTTGDGAVTARWDGSSLLIEGRFEGLASAATTAWLHVGAAIGVRGPSAHELVVTRDSSGTLSGNIPLSRAERDALQAGRLYVQIHSESAPDGNLWGWLLPVE